jgi:16S rRNA (cytosine967-C5)-methyltransferase
MNIRSAAARVILQVIDSGKSLSETLPPAVTRISEQRDAAFLQALVYGVCRRFFYLAAILDILLDKPLKDKDQDIYALMLVGLYQLTDMRVPAYAAVAETVDAVKNLKKPWAKNIVNAVLRNFQRREEEITALLAQDQAAFYAHPDWLIVALEKAWPIEWEDILYENNIQPPLALRVNARRQTRDEYLEKLRAAGINATAIVETQHGIVLDEPMDVLELPGFSAGEISVQDGAAQLAAELLMLAPELRVLDACAAPGGKTAHIAEIAPELAELSALDCDSDRLQVVRENLHRLHLSAHCITSDAANVQQWWDGKLFDRILLDAPCSASGVIRRHPDIKLLRRQDDIPVLAAEQFRLLNALWSVLKVGGILLYATCSIFPAENTEVLTDFLATHKDAQEEKINAEWGRACTIGRQIFPGMHGMDGFYYALLRKC